MEGVVARNRFLSAAACVAALLSARSLAQAAEAEPGGATGGSACERFRQAAGIQATPEWHLARLDCGASAAAWWDSGTPVPEASLEACRAKAAALAALRAPAGAGAYALLGPAAAAADEAPRKGRRVAADPVAAKFARELEATRKDLASRRGVDPASLGARTVLVDLPAAAVVLGPQAEEKLCEAASDWIEGVSGAARWENLARAAAGLAWVDRFERGAPADWQSGIAELVKSSARGGYPDRKERWDAVERSGSQFGARIARQARVLALGDLLASAGAALKAGHTGAACRSLAAAAKLAPDDDAVKAFTDKVRPTLDAARARAVSGLRLARSAREVVGLVLDIHAMDDLVGGPSAGLDAARRQLLPEAAGQVADRRFDQAIAAMSAIDDAVADYVQPAMGRLRGWVQEWVVREAAKLRARKAWAPGLTLVRRALHACPGDGTLRSLETDFAQQVDWQRGDVADRRFFDGFVATGLIAVEKDPKLGAERERLREAHKADVLDLRRKLRLVAVVSSTDPFAEKVAAGTRVASLSGPGWTTASAQPDPVPFWSTTLEFTQKRLDNEPARWMSSREATQRYASGSHNEANPKKAECEQDVSNRQERAASADEAYQEVQVRAQQCRDQASNAGGLGAAIAAAACTGGEAAALGVKIAMWAAYNKANAECRNTPDEIEVTDWADMPYTIETWGFDSAAELEIVLRDGQTLKPIWTTTVTASLSGRDDKVDGQPQYNIRDDPMTLPGPESVESALVKDLQGKVEAAAEEAVRHGWDLARSAIAEGQGNDQVEACSRVVVLAGDLGAQVPEELRREVEPCTRTAYAAVGISEPARMEVISDPAGAEVWLNGKRVGATPWVSEQHPAGTCEVVLRKEGFEERHEFVTLLDGEIRRWERKLVPAPASDQAAAPAGDKPRTP
jgi:hypothetical protein